VKPGHHGTTFGGNPIACRLGIAVLEEIESSNLLERVRITGAWFGRELQGLQSRHESVVDVRGMGLMWGIELDRPAGPVAAKLLAHGFVVGTAREKVLRLLPPYVVPKRALSEFIVALEQVLNEVPGDRLPVAATAPWSPVTDRRSPNTEGVLSK
jgi:acetylornithine/succinyldiaminopimelate/putrescine aminotransferase